MKRAVPVPTPCKPNECWSMVFVADRVADGRQIRLLTLVDNFSRISPAIEVDFSLTGRRVVEVLERLEAACRLPKVIKVDRGSEFISKAMGSGIPEMIGFVAGVERDVRAVRAAISYEWSNSQVARPSEPVHDDQAVDTWAGQTGLVKTTGARCCVRAKDESIRGKSSGARPDQI